MLINTNSCISLGILPSKLVSLVQASLMDVRMGPFDMWVCSGDTE